MPPAWVLRYPLCQAAIWPQSEGRAGWKVWAAGQKGEGRPPGSASGVGDLAGLRALRVLESS